MATATIRVSNRTHDKLRALSAVTGRPLNALVELAVESLRREQFFDELDSAYGRLRSAPDVWEDVSRERSAWDSTLADGLNDG